uniref:C-type lectin domain-containing protein n=1 Tax=Caenorhabditis tropicalis TaxID=1561998 RepID=A0A1I7U1E9_9PELO
MRLLLLSLLGITVVSGIIAPGYGGFGGGSSSYSSEEHHHGGRPHRPPRPHDDDPEPRCQRDWMTFQRPSGTWCIKVFYGPGTKYDADNACAAQGAVLTSLQNANERIQIASEA